LLPKVERTGVLALGRSIPESFQLVRGMFSSLQHRQFRLFFWTQLASASGDWIQIATVNIVVLRLTGGGNDLAFANLSAFVPMILLTPVAGAWADTRDKARLLAFANSGLLAVTASLGILAQTNSLSLPIIYIAAAAGGCFAAFDNTVRQALIGDIVPPGDLANGVGLGVTSMTAARAAGPFSAAILVPLLGIPGCFYVNACSYLFLLISLPRLRARRNEVVKNLLPRASLRAVAQAIWSDRSLSIPMVQIAVLSGFGITSIVLLPLFVVRTLHSPDWTYAVLAGLVGTGSVIGSLSMSARRIIGARPVAVCAICLSAMLVIVGISSSAVIAGLPLFLSGVFAACAIATALATMQIASAPEMRGRVIAAYMAVFTISGGLVAPATGFIAEATSPRVGYYICAAVVAASALLVLSSDRMRSGLPSGQKKDIDSKSEAASDGRSQGGRD
jgi:MFS family permease